MSLPLAIRNVFRNRWRSGLTMGGIALATALVIWVQCMTNAMLDQMVRGAVGVELGEVLIQSEAMVRERSLFHALPWTPETEHAIAGVAGVAALTPRVEAFGLIGHERRSVVGRMIGVDPAAEARATHLDRGVVAGAWLSTAPAPPPAPREVVLGRAVADQLGVAPGDELVVFLQAADGSLGNDVLKVVGTVRTGSSVLDRTALYAHLDDVQYLTALDGRVHEVAVTLASGADPGPVAAAIRAALPDPGPDGTALSVRPWFDVVPELHELVEFSRRYNSLIYVIVFLIAALGILNTQRMSVLERRRELGVLLAIGLSPARLAGIVVVETLTLTGLGGLLGMALGTAVSLYHARNGFDMAALSGNGEGFTYMGVTFDGRFYLQVSADAVLIPFAVIMAVALACGLWPALKAALLDPVRAIAGRT
ncbi:MAG: ABC transporter permease [Deltaproteobacteria bacterium]|nr:ABC transporter permease [Deltaproteobacteria bacterium]MCB9785639.1 ABC transporter permease [Deltaproteobacteria bacterium]